MEMARVFAELAAEIYLADIKVAARFAERASYYISEINAIHPFREGNGRCQLIFLTMLAANAGFALDEHRIDEAEIMQAMIDSFRGNLSTLAKQINMLIGSI